MSPTHETIPVSLEDGTILEITTLPGGWQIEAIYGVTPFTNEVSQLISEAISLSRSRIAKVTQAANNGSALTRAAFGDITRGLSGDQLITIDGHTRQKVLNGLIVSARTAHTPSLPGSLNRGETLFVWHDAPRGPSKKLAEIPIKSVGMARVA